MWVSSPMIVTEDRACPVIIPDQSCAGATPGGPGSRLPPAGWPGLREFLSAVPDPRHPGGVRHSLASEMLASVAAVLAGARSLAAIGEWVSDTPPDVLAALDVRFDPLAGRFRPPDEATIGGGSVALADRRGRETGSMTSSGRSSVFAGFRFRGR
jgi:DDE_Tnp_1-associated